MSLITEHQNDIQPQAISFSVDKDKLSGKTFYDPSGILMDYNKANLQFQSNKPFTYCCIRATLEGEDYDMETGELIAEITGTSMHPRPAQTVLTSTIIANKHLLKGDGTYRIGIYILDIDGY